MKCETGGEDAVLFRPLRNDERIVLPLAKAGSGRSARSLENAAQSEGAWLQIVRNEGDRMAVADLVAEGRSDSMGEQDLSPGISVLGARSEARREGMAFLRKASASALRDGHHSFFEPSIWGRAALPKIAKLPSVLQFSPCSGQTRMIHSHGFPQGRQWRGFCCERSPRMWPPRFLTSPSKSASCDSGSTRQLGG
jgi:hypothetical protein